jgi:hypothetical protein
MNCPQKLFNFLCFEPSALFAQFICHMLCLSDRIDILTREGASRNWIGCVPAGLIHRLLLSFLEIASPLIYFPSAAAVLHAPDLTLARWRPGSWASPWASVGAAGLHDDPRLQQNCWCGPILSSQQRSVKVPFFWTFIQTLPRDAWLSLDGPWTTAWATHPPSPLRLAPGCAPPPLFSRQPASPLPSLPPSSLTPFLAQNWAFNPPHCAELHLPVLRDCIMIHAANAGSKPRQLSLSLPPPAAQVSDSPPWFSGPY